MDPQLTKDGKPYGPFRYKELVKECYFITKNTHTTYEDVLNMTPNERSLILSFLLEEAKQIEKKQEEIRNKTQNKVGK